MCQSPNSQSGGQPCILLNSVFTEMLISKNSLGCIVIHILESVLHYDGVVKLKGVL